MNVMFLGGVFDLTHQDEIIKKTKTYVENAANSFQLKLIKGFEQNKHNVSVISAPFIGAYPHSYKEYYFNGFQKEDISNIKYVSFINIWGYRNISRSKALKRAVTKYTKEVSNDKLIIVYSPHTPLLEAACHAKKIDPSIKICLVVPDLPQYMNLSSSNRWLYDFFKKIDINRLYKLNKNVDGYILLTEPMKDVMRVGDKPYIVVEGLTSSQLNLYPEKNIHDRTIVYTGKLNEKFGVMNLVEAFKLIQDSSLKLIICGSGEQAEAIKKSSKQDSRISYKGQVSLAEATEYIKKASILVNPRQNNEVYTKYSFPSKIIDYLSTGNPVISYKLDGIPDEYDDFLFYVEKNSVESLKKTIEQILAISEKDLMKKRVLAFNYLNFKRTPSIVTNDIVRLFY